MHQSKLKRITLGVLLACLPFVANAAGLGKLNVMSGLGEPLSAEIEILSATPDELAGLTAAIAPEEAYTLQGLDRPGFHSLIKVEVRKKPGGSSFLKLSSNQPVTDPFLDMLVQVDFPTGRLVREFTLLLDPPDYANPSIASPVTSSASSPLKSSPSITAPSSNNGASASPDTTSGATARPSRNNARRPARPAAAPVMASPPPSLAADAAPVASSDITTARGDSLARIARQNQVEGVNLDQMLIGIYRANKSAFVDNNINRLKVGQIIRIPGNEELQSISAGEAAKEVRVHSADWQAYRSKLAGTVTETPAARDEGAASQQSSAGKIAAPVQDKSLPEVTGPRDVVKLSKNDSTSSKPTAENKGLQDKLSALQEEAVAREKSIKEANERTALLEKQIEDMKKLLAMKSQAMADIQKNAAAAEPPKVEPSPELPKAEALKVEPPKDAPAVTAPATTEPAPAPAPATTSPAVTEKPKPAVKPAIPVAAPAVPVEEPSFLDGLMENPLLLGLGAALVALLAGWLVLRNKRRRGLDGFEKSILTSGGLKANTVFGNTLGGSVNTGDTSFLTDFSQSSSGMIDTNDVDPIAEAEVYMAYGRDKQAEEILRDAISKEPTRYELHMKLLEVYAGRNDIAAFETTAGELYTTLGAQDPVWAKVAEMGRQIEPENPLYQGVSAPAPEEFTATNSNLKAADFAEEPISEKPSLDFSLDAGPEEVAGDAPFTSAVDSPQNEDSAVDFDLGEATQAEEPSYEATTAFNVADKESELDFQLDLGATEEPKNEIEFDLASPFDSEVKPDSEVEPDLKEADSTEAPVFDADAAEATVQMDMSELRLPEASPEAGEAAADTEQYAAAVPSETLPDFDISAPSVDAEENQFDLDKLPEFEPTFESAAPEISFDLPDPVIADVEDGLETVPQANAPADIELPSFEPSAPFEPTISPETPATEDIVFDSIPEQEDALDLDFDLGMPEDEPLTATAQPDAPEIDLSGISFDLDEAPALSSDEVVSEPEAILAESSEVDTKLDLVTAYIDMGDNEGAKELLDEILQEGGPNQRLRAQDILKTLG